MEYILFSVFYFFFSFSSPSSTSSTATAFLVRCRQRCARIEWDRVRTSKCGHWSNIDQCNEIRTRRKAFCMPPEKNFIQHTDGINRWFTLLYCTRFFFNVSPLECCTLFIEWYIHIKCNCFENNRSSITFKINITGFL